MTCQLKELQECFPSSLRQTLAQLPESLDETYVRVLCQISRANQGHAHRMLQCLMVAVRPLRVEELAELLAFEFDATQGGIPRYRGAGQLDDQTQAVFSTCSSLVTIVDNDDGQIVQFSHFSVKEFLTSKRLGDFSQYHIDPISAHTIFTQACLGFLLRFHGDHIDKVNAKGFPLAEYAARHWVAHAKFDGVVQSVKEGPGIKEGMETLFDSDKPHFAAWLRIYDMDRRYGRYPKQIPNPLYYSALCGFSGLVKHLAMKHPEQVNAIFGRYTFPLFAALEKENIEVAELLLKLGANVDARDTTGSPILLKVFSQRQRLDQRSLVKKVKLLLKYRVDVNVRDDTLTSPLHLAEYRGELEVAKILVKHNADVNSQDSDGKTPLHMLSEGRANNEADVLDHARLLLKRGAEVNKRDENYDTPLHVTIRWAWFKFAQILLEHGADAAAENNQGETPLHVMSKLWIMDSKYRVLDQLLEHGADTEVNRRDNASLPLAIVWLRLNLAQILLENGADTNEGGPLHLRSKSRCRSNLDIMWPLLESGVVVNSRDKNSRISLLLEMGRDSRKIVRVLLEKGANANAKGNNDQTPWRILLSESQIYHIASKAQYEGTAAWFFQGKRFKDWMSTGSLLWIHGKRKLLLAFTAQNLTVVDLRSGVREDRHLVCHFLWSSTTKTNRDYSSAIIKHLMSLRDDGKASLAYFYFDFRDKVAKQDSTNFVTSLVTQLSAYSSPCFQILSRMCSTDKKGTRYNALKKCLREMLKVTAIRPTYIIVDALDECPDLSIKIPTPRQVVLRLVKDLVDLRFPNLHICVTSQPEIDIKEFLGPLASSSVSLHDESGQQKDIFDYVSGVVSSDSMMQRWRSDQRVMVVEELSKKADGM